MATSNSKRPVEEDEEDSSASENEECSDEEMGEDEELGENDKEIQVEFEGQSPCEDDFHGIKNLLHQLFLKAKINLGGLAELVVQQNYVGSVLMQCPVDDEDQDSDEGDNPAEEVFGITSVINLSHHKEIDSVKDVMKYLTERTNKKLGPLLEEPNNRVGLLLNERFINIPPQVSVPLLENLSKEMETARSEGKPFDFTHFVLISKLHEATRKDSEARKKKVKGDNQILWVNAEEEAISELAEIVGEFSVRSESDSAVSGTWDEEDEQFDPKRRIMVFPASGFPECLVKIKEFLN